MDSSKGPLYTRGMQVHMANDLYLGMRSSYDILLPLDTMLKFKLDISVMDTCKTCEKQIYKGQKHMDVANVLRYLPSYLAISLLTLPLSSARYDPSSQQDASHDR